GIVTYSNRIKEDILGVSKETIEQYGVVSAPCAIEMAQTAKEQFGADISVSFTGVAGPAELEGQKSGTVWIGCAFKENDSYAKCFHFGKGRNSNREQAVLSALDMIRRELLGKPIEGKIFLKD
ncbi:MAG: nicotinamide-nucleotide amidohydrolase family protein, partial [Carnobacterium inhibens]|uniref:CinA family protein n=1 Tax=Carnobacterium inhibens TaxID=147709 RepID=UPI0033148100